MRDNIKTSIETITPQRAKQYLEAKAANRPVRMALVKQYARDMANEEWKLSHQGIAFDEHNYLIDGQHRLSAIIESGVPTTMLVARGVPLSSQIAMDDHAKRSAGDAISLIRSEKVTQSQVALMRVVIEFGGSGKPTKHELNHHYDTFRDCIAFIMPYYSRKERSVTASPVWAAIMMAWFYEQDLERLQLFCRILKGDEIPYDEYDRAATTLREWLLRTRVSTAGGVRRECYRKTMKAVEHFMQFRSLCKLYDRGRHQKYPWPLVDPIRVTADDE